MVNVTPYSLRHLCEALNSFISAPSKPVSVSECNDSDLFHAALSFGSGLVC